MLSKIVKLLKCLYDLKLLCSLKHTGLLFDSGWWESRKRNLPVDRQGNPLPWLTYSFIYFISERLSKKMEIFEFGSGNSTLWYAEKVMHVASIEHDEKWYKKIKKMIPDNVEIYFQRLVYSEDYFNFPNAIGKKFDIIIIDGRNRVNCMKNSIHSLKDNGIIILDDSEREQYQQGINYLIQNEFKRIDFWGISPGCLYKKCTSVFYKNENCLKI